MTQVVINILARAGALVLVGVGFYFIYRAACFFHFAHGVVVALGAYSLLLLRNSLGFGIALACCFSIVLCGLVGCGMERLAYRPLTRRRSSALVLLLASLGIYVVLQNAVSIAFGDEVQTVRAGAIARSMSVLGARMTLIQLITICVALSLIVAVGGLGRYTRFGIALRAVANDRGLAVVSGIKDDQVILWTFALGSALAGAGGVLIALDVGMTPTMGIAPLLIGIVGVIAGGARSTCGVSLGVLSLAAVQNLVARQIGSQWQDAVTFAILLAFLLFRPAGLFTRGAGKAVL